MKEKIIEILKDESLTTPEEKSEAIAKGLATLVIPKDKFNSLSEKNKALESEKESIANELEELKTKTMSEEEKKTKEQEKFEKQRKELSLELNKIKAKEIFKDANIAEDKVEELLGKVVSDDEAKTLELANSFASILKTNTENAKKEAETGLLEDTPKPAVKAKANGNQATTIEDFVKMSYSEKKQLFESNPDQYNQLTEQEINGNSKGQ